MGGKRGGTQTVTQKSDPWSGAVPYLIGSEGKPGVLPEAERLYQEGKALIPYTSIIQSELIKSILANKLLYDMQRDYYMQLFNHLTSGRMYYNPFQRVFNFTSPIVNEKGGENEL